MKMMISDEKAKQVTGGEAIETDLMIIKKHAVQGMRYGATTDMERHYCEYCRAKTMQVITVRGYVCLTCRTVNEE